MMARSFDKAGDLGPNGLPLIPLANRRLTYKSPELTREPSLSEGWLVIGPATLIKPGHPCAVWRKSTSTYVTVQIKDFIAERLVQHRSSSYTGRTAGQSTLYVIATFE
jgi:hypothetical protein